MKNLFAVFIFVVCMVVASSTVIADLNDGLVAYYPFNGNANDESGNGNNGVVFGATLTADRHGNSDSAYSFDGTDRIEIPDSPTLTLSNQFTIASWAKLNAFSADNGYYLMGHSEGPGDTSKWIFWLGSNNIKLIITISGGGWIHIGDTSNFQIDQWYHVIIRRNGNELTAFVNGVTIGSATVSIDTPDPNAVFQIGTAEGDRPNRVFNGSIDEVRIYNRALSNCEIQTLHSGIVANQLSLSISPSTGNYFSTQNFDLGIMVNTCLPIVGASATFDGYDVTAFLGSCVIRGTLVSGGLTFRCPGVIMGSLGTGTHTLDVKLDFSDGSSVSDTVTWDVKGNTEP